MSTTKLHLPLLTRTLTLATAIAAATAVQTKTIFVSTTGNDSAAGTMAAPLASLAAAHAKATAGDTIYLRGGTYRIGESQIMSTQEKIYACVFDLTRSGTAAKRTVIAGYPGERPVFDLSDVKPEGKRVSVFYIHGNYLHLKNFDIVGTQVTITTHTQSEAISIRRGGSHNIIEDIAIHDGMSIGVYMTKGADNLVINCDAYNNFDSVSEGGRGGNSDGFGCHVRAQDTGNVFRGCRAWCNSDDGYDLINCYAPVVFDNCWAFYNGYKDFSATTPGDGNGFKAGGYGKNVQDSNFDVPHHTINQCIAYSNKANGFYANHHLGGCTWTNNSAMSNKYNYSMVNQQQWDVAEDVPGYGHVLRNNVSYKPRRDHYTMIDQSLCTIENNSFLPASMAVGEGDFVSTAYAEMTRPRKADTSLPDISFLKLKPESQLYDKKMGWQFSPDDTPDGITAPQLPQAKPAPQGCYTLSGTLVHPGNGRNGTKQIMIINGKKILKFR